MGRKRKPKGLLRVQVGGRVLPEIAWQLRRYAEENGRTRSSVVAEATEAFLRQKAAERERVA